MIATATTAGPVVFAGRFATGDPGVPVITEALPRAIRPLDPSHWVVVDPVAFPYEAMTDRHWDAPMSVVLPSSLGAEGLLAVLGAPLLGRLTPYDVVVSAPWLWNAVRPAYSLAETQWRPLRGGVEQVVADLVRGAENADALEGLLSGGDTADDSTRLVTKWDVRARGAKARHRAEVEALRPMLRRVMAAVPPGRTGSAIEFSDDAHGFVSLVGRSVAEMSVARDDPTLGTLTAMAYPDHAVGSPGDASLSLRIEHADIAVGRIEQPDRATTDFVAAVWDGLRVGGSMVVVVRADVATWTRERLTRMVLDVSAGSAVLTAVDGVQDPVSGRAGSVVFAFTRIGSPRTW